MFLGPIGKVSRRTTRRGYPVYAGLVVLAFLAVVLISCNVEFHLSPLRSPDHHVSASRAQPRLEASYGKLPLSFELNRGQADAQVQFLSRGSGYTLFLTHDEAVLSLRSQKSGVRSWRPGSRDIRFSGWPDGSGRQGPLGLRQSRRATASGLRTTDLVLGSLIANLESQFGSHPAITAQPPAPDLVRLRLVGANPVAKAVGEAQLPGRSNYFIGNDPRKWRTNVPTYAKVRYKNVYPGVDLDYHGNQRQLEYDFVVAPGADAARILLNVDLMGQPGNKQKVVRLDADGDLVIQTDGGEARFHKPVVYQPEVRSSGFPGHSSRVEGHYLLTASNQVRFALGPYDPTKPLVIDPVLSYSTYLGGSGGDLGNAIAVDSAGNAYVTGETFSTDFPTTNPIQGSLAGVTDVFIAKLNPTGSAPIYSTYLGGHDNSYSQDVYATDCGTGIAADSSGNVYVTGFTASTDFPTVNPLQRSLKATVNGFVAKLNASGSGLVYSTYLGGSGGDFGGGIAVDSTGNAYVTGTTFSEDFPTVNAFQPQKGSTTCPGYSQCPDAFVAKLNASGSALVYSTYLGGSDAENTNLGGRIAVDSAGNAYVSGETWSTDFPTVNPLQAANGGVYDGFVAKLNPSGSALVYSTYLGGSDFDSVLGIAVDATGNASVTGYTSSTDFPTTSGAFQTNCNTSPGSCEDAFVAKLRPDGSALVYSTYLGGSGDDGGTGIALDPAGNAYVTGSTESSDFPTMNAVQSSYAGNGGVFCAPVPCGDAFVAQLNTSGSGLVYSTYLGGSQQDAGEGVAVDSAGNAYVTGYTTSTNFPTLNPPQPSYGGGGTGCGPFSCGDAFVAKIGPADSPGIAFGPGALSFAAQFLGTTSPSQPVTLTAAGSQPLVLTGITISGDFALANTPSSCPYTGGTEASGTTCTIDVTFTPTTSGTRAGQITVTDNSNGAAGSTQTVSLSGTGMVQSVAGTISLFPAKLGLGYQQIGTTSPGKPFLIRNTGSGPFTFISVAASGDFAASSSCPSSLNPGASCEVNVTFTPNGLGTRAGIVTVAANASNSPQTITLTGTGVGPVTLWPASAGFSSLAGPETFTLHNNMATTLENIAISTTGDFAVISTTCGTSQAPISKCTIDVSATATQFGAYYGTLTVSDSASNSPQVSQLSIFVHH